MKMNKKVLGLAVAIVGLTALTQVPSVSASWGEKNRSEHSPISIEAVAIKEAAAITIAKTKLDGTVVKIHLDRYHGKATWKVRILSTDGTQKGSVRIDANSGEILNFTLKSVGEKKEMSEKKYEFKKKFASLKKYFSHRDRK